MILSGNKKKLNAQREGQKGRILNIYFSVVVLKFFKGEVGFNQLVPLP